MFRGSACFCLAVVVSLAGIANAVPTIAYNSLPSLSGQGHTGGIGHDFVVNSPIVVTRLGVYDQGGDGIANATITAQLWQRNDNGTPGNATGDDFGVAALATAVFNNGSAGTLAGSSAYRFKDLTTPLILAPGTYSIVGYGFGGSANDQNANGGGAGFGTFNSGGGLISAVGTSRWNLTGPGIFPNITDAHPFQYGSATFEFFSIAELPEPSSWIAFLTVFGAAAVVYGKRAIFRKR
jgi:hypothetical protein